MGKKVVFMLNHHNINEIHEIIGKKVYERRKQLKMKQSELAQKTDLSTNYIRKIEYGQTNITIHVLRSLCIALDLKITDLLIFQHPDKNLTHKARFIHRIEQMDKLQREHYFKVLEDLITHFKTKED